MDSIAAGLPLSEIPALEPPPGVKSNFNNPHSLTHALIVVNAVFLALMLITLTIRIYTKGPLLHSLGWDDYTALIAAAGSIAHSGVIIEQTRHGLGRHQWDVPLSYLTGNDIQILQAETILSYITQFFVKFSILLFYLRLFSVNRTIRYLIWAGIILQFMGYAAFTGCAIGLEVICTNPANAETITFCVNNYKVTYTQGLFAVLTDFYVLLLPISVVLKLQLSFRRKIGVITVFLTGLLACVASLVRTVVSIQRLHTKDTFYEAGYVSIFSAVELNTGIIAGALIVFPIFLSKSGLVSFGKSAIASLRSRLFSPVQTSLSGRKSGGANGKFKMENQEGSYIELSEAARNHATPWHEGEKAQAKEGGIVRTDDYEVVAYSDPSVGKAYAPV